MPLPAFDHSFFSDFFPSFFCKGKAKEKLGWKASVNNFQVLPQILNWIYKILLGWIIFKHTNMHWFETFPISMAASFARFTIGTRTSILVSSLFESLGLCCYQLRIIFDWLFCRSWKKDISASWCYQHDVSLQQRSVPG